MKINDSVLNIFHGMHGFVPDSLICTLIAHITNGSLL